MSRSVRLLALLQLLRGRRLPVTATQLARELEVSERTVYRDLAALADQGAPISGEAGIGYVLKPGLFLPPLMLQGEEVEAILLGLRYVDQRGDAPLRQAAVCALAKIDAVLTPEARGVRDAPLAMPGPPAQAFPSETPANERSGRLPWHSWTPPGTSRTENLMEVISGTLPEIIKTHVAAHNRPDPEAFLASS